MEEPQGPELLERQEPQGRQVQQVPLERLEQPAQEPLLRERLGPEPLPLERPVWVEVSRRVG